MVDRWSVSTSNPSNRNQPRLKMQQTSWVAEEPENRRNLRVVPPTLVSNANNGVGGNARTNRSTPHARVALNSRGPGYRLVNRCGGGRGGEREATGEGKRRSCVELKLEPRAVDRVGGGERLSLSMHRRGRGSGIWSGVRVTSGGAVSASSARMRSRCRVRVSVFNRRIRTISGAMRAAKSLKGAAPAADNFKLVPKHLSYTLRG